MQNNSLIKINPSLTTRENLANNGISIEKYNNALQLLKNMDTTKLTLGFTEKDLYKAIELQTGGALSNDMLETISVIFGIISTAIGVYVASFVNISQTTPLLANALNLDGVIDNPKPETDYISTGIVMLVIFVFITKTSEMLYYEASTRLLGAPRQQQTQPNYPVIQFGPDDLIAAPPVFGAPGAATHVFGAPAAGGSRKKTRKNKRTYRK